MPDRPVAIQSTADEGWLPWFCVKMGTTDDPCGHVRGVPALNSQIDLEYSLARTFHHCPSLSWSRR